MKVKVTIQATHELDSAELKYVDEVGLETAIKEFNEILNKKETLEQCADFFTMNSVESVVLEA